MSSSIHPAGRAVRGRHQRREFHPSRWPLRAFTILVVTVFAVVGWRMYERGHETTFTSLPAPSIPGGTAGTAPDGGETPGIPGASASSTASGSAPSSSAAAALTTGSSSSAASSAVTGTQSDSGSASTTTAAGSSAVSFGSARAVQVYIPNSDPNLTISTAVQPLSGCRTVINPPHSGSGFGGVFGCTDFAQPGPKSPSLSVIAGHSANGIATAFNRLYVQGQSLVGQQVFLRTAASGTHWLVYRIHAVYTPDKKDLPYMTSVWGGDGSSTAGRLIVVTCRQDPGSSTATHNYVAVAQFEGVR